MCLFNRDIQGMNCGHEECKNYYMLNKQMCMYGLNQPSSSNAIKPTTNTIQKPIAQTSQPAGQKSTQSFNPPQDLNVKRPRTALGDSSSGDLDASPTNKLVKTETDDKTEGSNQKMMSESQSGQVKIPETSQFSQPSSTVGGPGGDKNLLNNIILNNLLQTGGTMKPDASMQKMTNPNILLSLLQNPPGNFNLNSQLQNKPMSQQPGMNPLGFPQLFPQNMGAKSGPMGGINPGANAGFGLGQDNLSPNAIDANTMNVANLINDIKLKSENGLSGDSFLKEFQGRILGLLFTQNKMLTDLKEKNDVLQDTLACLINEINTIKSSTKPVGKEKVASGTSSSLIPSQFMGSNTETVSVEDLINFLYGPSPDFQYQLILKSDLPLPLYRERNFKFTVMLTDKNGNVVENSNRIPLTIGLYSSENPPKYIDANTAGNKILKGFIEKDLTNGSATFEKIQIKEVTSHFRNGWIFFVVYPKVTNAGANNMLMGASGVFINSQKIKPLILEKVVVKAKKAKEKEAANEMDGQDDNPSVHNEDKEDESGK